MLPVTVTEVALFAYGSSSDRLAEVYSNLQDPAKPWPQQDIVSALASPLISYPLVTSSSACPSTRTLPALIKRFRPDLHSRSVVLPSIMRFFFPSASRSEYLERPRLLFSPSFALLAKDEVEMVVF